jgi:uncharacterized protein
MRVKRNLIVMMTLVLAGFVSVPQARADDASKKEKAEQLFALINMERTYDQMMAQVMSQSDQMQKQMFPDGTRTALQKKEFADFQAKLEALVRDSFSWKVLEPEYIKLYCDTYTEDDLDGIITFYHSPAGEDMLAKQPELLKASSVIAMSHMKDTIPKMQQLVTDMQKQIQADKENEPVN